MVAVKIVWKGSSLDDVFVTGAFLYLTLLLPCCFALHF